MTDGKDKIGDALRDAAQTGVIGARRPATTRQPVLPEAKPAAQDEQREREKPERKKYTFMLSPALAKWLKIQAATEEKEMSDIVAEALESYRLLHPTS